MVSNSKRHSRLPYNGAMCACNLLTHNMPALTPVFIPAFRAFRLPLPEASTTPKVPSPFTTSRATFQPPLILEPANAVCVCFLIVIQTWAPTWAKIILLGRRLPSATCFICILGPPTLPSPWASTSTHPCGWGGPICWLKSTKVTSIFFRHGLCPLLDHSGADSRCP